MSDQQFASGMLLRAGALMSASGVLIALCVKVAYGGILFVAAFCRKKFPHCGESASG